MPTLLQIPIPPPPCTFNTTLGNLAVTMTLHYNDMSSASDGSGGGWLADITDQLGNPLVMGLQLVTGCDLLAPYASMGFNTQMFISTQGAADDVPGFTDLGNATGIYLLLPNGS